MDEFAKEVDNLIKYNPYTQYKLHLLIYDNSKFVERKLKELQKDTLCASETAPQPQTGRTAAERGQRS